MQVFLMRFAIVVERYVLVSMAVVVVRHWWLGIHSGGDSHSFLPPTASHLGCCQREWVMYQCCSGCSWLLGLGCGFDQRYNCDEDLHGVLKAEVVQQYESHSHTL